MILASSGMLSSRVGANVAVLLVDVAAGEGAGAARLGIVEQGLDAAVWRWLTSAPGTAGLLRSGVGT